MFVTQKSCNAVSKTARCVASATPLIPNFGYIALRVAWKRQENHEEMYGSVWTGLLLELKEAEEEIQKKGAKNRNNK